MTLLIITQSFEWAKAIKPQKGLNSLPVEVRLKIHNNVFNLTYLSCAPKYERCLGKFVNKMDNSQIHTYMDMALVCRQFYVDIVGHGTFYRMVNFHFQSVPEMTRYTTSITPFHASVIKSMDLSFWIHYRDVRHLQRFIEVAATKLTSLENLNLSLYHEGGTVLTDLISNTKLWEPLAGKFKNVVFMYWYWTYCKAVEAEREAIEKLVVALLVGCKPLT